MQDLGLVASLILNVIMLVLTALMYVHAVRVDRRTKEVLDESERPYLVATLGIRRDRYGNDLSFLTVYNLHGFPAKNIRFKYDKAEIDDALQERDHADEFRKDALASLASDIPLVEKGTPVSMPFGLQCPDPVKSPERARTLSGEPDKSRTWKQGAVIRLRMDYQDLTGRSYQSGIQEINTDIYWQDAYPDHSL
ncbi:MAG: hypothetical protein AB1646_10115 [Thermodesulfobacteriota bacterium]